MATLETCGKDLFGKDMVYYYQESGKTVDIFSLLHASKQQGKYPLHNRTCGESFSGVDPIRICGECARKNGILW